MNLLVDQSGAPLSMVLTGANRHDKVAAIDLIVSMSVKGPAHKEQHLCADKAYDASEVRKFAASTGYTTPHQDQSQKERLNRTEQRILPTKRPPRGASSGEEMGGGADALLAHQASRPSHSLV